MGWLVGGGHILWRGVSSSRCAIAFITQIVDGRYNQSLQCFQHRKLTWFNLQIVYIANTTYLTVAVSVNISITLFLMRVFPIKSIRWSGWGVIIFIVVLALSGSLAMVFQCVPIPATWDKTITEKKCFSDNTLFGITMYQAVLMFVLDMVIICLPMPSIWRLQMPVRRRASITVLFALGELKTTMFLDISGRFSFVYGAGILSCVAALIRLPTLVFQNDGGDYTRTCTSNPNPRSYAMLNIDSHEIRWHWKILVVDRCRIQCSVARGFPSHATETDNIPPGIWLEPKQRWKLGSLWHSVLLRPISSSKDQSQLAITLQVRPWAWDDGSRRERKSGTNLRSTCEHPIALFELLYY